MWPLWGPCQIPSVWCSVSTLIGMLFSSMCKLCLLLASGSFTDFMMFNSMSVQIGTLPKTASFYRYPEHSLFAALSCVVLALKRLASVASYLSVYISVTLQASRFRLDCLALCCSLASSLSSKLHWLYGLPNFFWSFLWQHNLVLSLSNIWTQLFCMFCPFF